MFGKKRKYPFNHKKEPVESVYAGPPVEPPEDVYAGPPVDPPAPVYGSPSVVYAGPGFAWEPVTSAGKSEETADLKICDKCGNGNLPSEDFCVYCGNKLKKEE